MCCVVLCRVVSCCVVSVCVVLCCVVLYVLCCVCILVPTRFKCLKYLDVSGIRYDEYVSCGLLPLGTFPPTLETLRMSNCLDFIGHHNHGPGDIARNLATAYKQLTILDISINDMEKCLLVELSKGLDQLQYLNVCGKDFTVVPCLSLKA